MVRPGASAVTRIRHDVTQLQPQVLAVRRLQGPEAEAQGRRWPPCCSTLATGSGYLAGIWGCFAIFT